MVRAVNAFTWLLVLSGLLGSCNNTQEKIQPKLGQITQSVYSSVIIQPDSLYTVYAAINGILERNLAEEGDTVARGDKLLQVVNTAPQLNAENARLSLQLAQDNYSGSSAVLSTLEEEIRAAELTLANDSVFYYRQKNLWNNQIGSKAEYDALKLRYELSENKLRRIKENYFRIENELKVQLTQAKNNYNAALAGSKDFTVQSKINGKVYALYKNPGEVVNTQQALALVGSASDFIIEMLVDEVDIVKVRKGQQVIVSLDAYKEQLFTARVTKIYPKKDQRNQTFVIEGLFNEPPKVLYPGLAGEASILISKKKEAVIIPKEYLVSGNQVQTQEGLVEVKIGLQSLDSVEVLSGINGDTWIYKPEQ